MTAEQITKKPQEEEKPLTKRARRKLGAHPSQAWPQMPKIATPAARAKAYLRVAGLSTKLSANSLDPSIDLHSPEVRYCRLLVSPEQRKRHEAVRVLGEYLKRRCDIANEKGGLSEMDLLKLWKGLWYTLYLADRVPVQDEVSKEIVKLLWCVAGTEEEDEYAGKAYLDMYGGENENEDDDEDDVVMEVISDGRHVVNDQDEEDDKNEEESEEGDDGDDDEDDENEDDNPEEEHEDDEDGLEDSMIPHCRGAHLAALFVKTFFQTIRREWGRMDKYRIDKFYTLIRLMMHQVYGYMAKRHWNLGIIRLFNDTIYEEVLTQTPNGLRYHLIDLAMEELAKVNAQAPMPLTEATFTDCIEPYFALSQNCDDKIVQARVMEKVLLNFLNSYSIVSDKAVKEGDDAGNSLIMDQVHVGTLANYIFTLASDAITKDEYRESLYTAYKDYMRRLKKAGKDVPLAQYEDGEENEEYSQEDVTDQNEEVRIVVVDDPINLSELDDLQQEVGHDETDELHNTRENSAKTDENKRKRRFQDEEREENVEKEKASETKKRKRKKKKNGEVPTVARSRSEVEHVGDKGKAVKFEGLKEKKKIEEVHTISLAQQQLAAQAAKSRVIKQSGVVDGNRNETGKTKLLTKKKERSQDADSSEEKKVKFGKVNFSKSWKASMKALSSMESPKLEKVTPEKSILRIKSPKSTSSTEGKKARKKAVDYF